MMRLLPAALAALALSLGACSDPTEAYTPVDELPSAQDPAADRPETARLPDDAMHDPAPLPDDPMRDPTQPEQLPPLDPEIPPPMDPVPPIDEASRPPPVDPTLDDADPIPEPAS